MESFYFNFTTKLFVECCWCSISKNGTFLNGTAPAMDSTSSSAYPAWYLNNNAFSTTMMRILGILGLTMVLL